MTRKWLCFVLSAVLLVSLCGCVPSGGDKDPEEPKGEPVCLVDDAGAFRYALIRPDFCTNELRTAVNTMKKTLEEKTGSTVSAASDWQPATDGDVYEILIGDTNRPESLAANATLGYADYVVCVSGTKVVLAGGCEAATQKAMSIFTDFCAAPYTFPQGVVASGSLSVSLTPHTVTGQSSVEAVMPFEGVVRTHYHVAADTLYGAQDFYTVEFDPTDPTLRFMVTCCDEGDITHLSTVKNTVEKISATHPELTVLEAVNGDLWMNFAHARVRRADGTAYNYNGYDNPVVTSEFNVLRSFDVYNGEIVSSPHIPEETPYEDDFFSFGVTTSGQFVFGKPALNISVSTPSGNLTPNGLNRLPVEGALVLYSHRVDDVPALEDAYSVVVRCGDYTVKHGATVSGTVVKMVEGAFSVGDDEFVLTARGAAANSLKKLKVGDAVSATFSVVDRLGNNEAWQNMLYADGGHDPIMRNGTSCHCGDESRIPTTLFGIKYNGNVVIMINDGRQGNSHSLGFRISQLDLVCRELGLRDAFISDGGGSSTLVERQPDGTYRVLNIPSDTNPDGTFGCERAVAGTVLIARVEE